MVLYILVYFSFNFVSFSGNLRQFRRQQLPVTSCFVT
ncbi:hypothetical protein V6Z11_D12G003300 [Gossypium hirsutum]